MLDVLLYRVNKLCLILLDGTSNLGNEDRFIYFKGLNGTQRTLGRMKRALNLENTLNISFALRAVPGLSRSLAMIWFSTLSIRSLYALSAATQMSVPSAPGISATRSGQSHKL